MSSRKEAERSKLIQEKCQTMLTKMLRDEDNKYCVDCDAKGPRWASWNLGVFLCIRCAGIHRNLGVHISRVKSVNLDTWTPEQVLSLQQMGNSRARAVYEAQLPDGFRRPQTDSALESFVRAKYENRKYLAREWIQPQLPKVDWVKEIDEEIEKQKRKKKAAQTNSALGIVVPINNDKKSSLNQSTIPAPIPKPKSLNSPKINRNDATRNSTDLLGLSSPINTMASNKLSLNDTQNDTFNSFLGETSSTLSSSFPVQQNGEISNNQINNTNKISQQNLLAKEEEDFFKQSNNIGQGEKDKVKLTKDSILALYGTPQTNNIGQFNTNQLSGYNNTFTQSTNSQQQFMPVTIQQQTYSNFSTGNIITHQNQPQYVHTGINNNLNMNLAGRPPPGFFGPPQHHLPAQFMTPPNSVTMYNSPPVMTAPGAFTSAIPSQHISQPSFAQFPGQTFGTISSVLPTTISSSSTVSTSTTVTTNLTQQFGNLNLGNVWQ